MIIGITNLKIIMLSLMSQSVTGIACVVRSYTSPRLGVQLLHCCRILFKLKSK